MRKRLVAIFDAATMPDLTGLLQVAAEFKIDVIDGDDAPAPRKAVHRPGGGHTASTTIMDHFTPCGSFTRVTAIGWLTQKGYNKNTISSALLPLIRDGYIRDLGDHRYQFAKPWA